MRKCSDYIVYADEREQASPDSDPNYPSFVLAFCLFEKSYYCEELAPSLQKLKFRYFGHDTAVFHERDIRKAINPFNILIDKKIRHEFMSDLTILMDKTNFGTLSHTIVKNGKYQPEENLYHLAAQKRLDLLHKKLKELTRNPDSRCF